MTVSSGIDFEMLLSGTKLLMMKHLQASQTFKLHIDQPEPLGPLMLEY